MTNPAWVVLFTKIAGARDRHRRDDVAPGRAVARVRDPGRHRDVRRRRTRSAPATGSASTVRTAWSRSCSREAAEPSASPIGLVMPATAAVRNARAERPRRPGQGTAARGNPRRPLRTGRADRRDAGGPRARHEPGAGSRGAARARGARGRRDHPVPRSARPPSHPTRAARGLRRSLRARDARRRGWPCRA